MTPNQGLTSRSVVIPLVRDYFQNEQIRFCKSLSFGGAVFALAVRRPELQKGDGPSWGGDSGIDCGDCSGGVVCGVDGSGVGVFGVGCEWAGDGDVE